MGKLILCPGKKAQHPYRLTELSVSVYTLEELCYVIEKHIFSPDRSWIGEALFRWILEELDLPALAKKLRTLYRPGQQADSCLLLLFKESGLYPEETLQEMSDLILRLREKTSIERKKMEADDLLKQGCLRQAAYCYLELLQPEGLRRMTEELQGNIYHNLGVIYAKEFLFPEAADMFARAWEKRKNPASKEAYFAARRLAEDTTHASHLHQS